MIATDKRKPAFRIAAKAMAKALADVVEVTPAGGKDTIPILNTVRMEASDGVLTLTGCDLDQWIIRSLPTSDREPNSAEWLASIRPFATCVPARALLAIVKQIDADAMVTVAGPTDKESRVTITAGRSRFRVACLPVDDFPFPTRPDFEHSFSIAAGALRDVFARVEHAISTEETRYYLNGVYMHPQDLDQRFAATDGHRLARLVQDGPDGAASFPAVIIGRRTVAVLDKLLDAAGKVDTSTSDDADKACSRPMVEVDSDSNGRVIYWAMPAPDGGEVTLIAKTVDGTFPDYARVIPSAPSSFLTVDREALLAAIKRVAAVCSDKTRAVKLELDGAEKAIVSTASPEIGDAMEEIACEYAGEPLTIGFNGDYWRSCLSAVATDKVLMKFTDAGGPCRIEAEGGESALVQVLMPLRV
ncbi:DNA polymerase III beta subunit family protein [Novosphingobium aromaticivorans DSM 12444]|uniref:Beta sliding clamp n=1 Tax=Novosphingobium aromaticivorans (strain ATCC 700278 / DSM 12444 / CCUG 56034 / CIP 105152 / NBRC 16084 / F199) TaxID=279238 RepID=Q2GAN7_NOVAD|nr:DNA polymerase III subunit beta [Novosphingobium aromaticivorans]ABD25086.1 DNA polymerase III beta subunit family protein [Novosphingobium aromaticivorans DSM 12444]SCY96018.1 DNA polymerase III beta subunit family protein [Novosphingobium aromaticivorans]